MLKYWVILSLVCSMAGCTLIYGDGNTINSDDELGLVNVEPDVKVEGARKHPPR